MVEEETLGLAVSTSGMEVESLGVFASSKW